MTILSGKVKRHQVPYGRKFFLLFPGDNNWDIEFSEDIFGRLLKNMQCHFNLKFSRINFYVREQKAIGVIVN